MFSNLNDKLLCAVNFAVPLNLVLCNPNGKNSDRNGEANYRHAAELQTS